MEKQTNNPAYEDSFSIVAADSDQYLNLSRIDQDHKMPNDMPQNLNRQGSDPTNLPSQGMHNSYVWPADPAASARQQPPAFQQYPQPDMMNIMMQQMLSNPMMMTSLMMNQFQMMQQQMAGGGVSRYVPPSPSYDSVPQVQAQTRPQNMQKQVSHQTFMADTNAKVIEGRFDTFDTREGPTINKVSVRNAENHRDVDVGSYMQNRRKQQMLQKQNMLVSEQPKDSYSNFQAQPDSFRPSPDEIRLRQNSSHTNTTFQNSIVTGLNEFMAGPGASQQSSAMKTVLQPTDIKEPPVFVRQQQPAVRRLNQNDLPIRPLKQTFNYDDMPIKAKPLQPQDLEGEEQKVVRNRPAQEHTGNKKNPVPFDQIPIKGMNTNNFNELLDRKLGPSQQPTTYDQIRVPQAKRASERTKPDPYKQFQERPLKGVNKNFEELIEQKMSRQQPVAYNNAIDEEAPEPRVNNFLKKGSRQFLSSAKYNKSGAHGDDKKKNNPKVFREEDSSLMKANVQPPQAKPKVSVVTGKPRGVPLQAKPRSPAHRKIVDTSERSVEKSRSISNNSRSPEKVSKHKVSIPSQKRKQKTSNLFQSSVQGQDELDQQIITGVRVTPSQYEKITEKILFDSESSKIQQQRVQKLRHKYEEMLILLQQQKEKLVKQNQIQRQEFQEYKKQEMKIIKNQKRIAERQKQAVCNNTNKKDKQQLEAAKKEWEKEKQDLKKKENSSRIIIQKQKREIDELKRQLTLKDSMVDSVQTVSATEFQNKRRYPKDMDKSLQKDPKKGGILKKSIGDENSSQKDDIQRRKTSNNTDVSEQLLKQSQKAKTPKNDLSSATGNTSALSKYMPDYEDLKTDRAKSGAYQKETPYVSQPSRDNAVSIKEPKKDPMSIATVKVMSKNEPPSVLSQDRHGMFNYHEQKSSKGTSQKPNWNIRGRQSDDQDPRSNQNDSHESSFEQYNEGLQLSDLNSMKLSIRMVTEEMIENMFHYYSNEEYQRYQQIRSRSRKLVDEQPGREGKVIRTYQDGGKEIIFKDGVKKQTLPDGFTIIHFKNRDIKQKLSDGTTLYFFSDKQVDQITLLNKTNIFRFENNQVQFHYADGLIEIRHVDGSIKVQNK